MLKENNVKMFDAKFLYQMYERVHLHRKNMKIATMTTERV